MRSIYKLAETITAQDSGEVLRIILHIGGAHGVLIVVCAQS